MPRPISLIVIHCSASPNGDSLFRGSPGTPGFWTPVEDIDSWHARRGFKRELRARTFFNPHLHSIGYHYIIYRNGAIVTGRSEDEVGAHVHGYNQKSLGICLIGTDQFTAAQWKNLRELVQSLQSRYPGAAVTGHRDLSPDKNSNGVIEPCEYLKACPCFNVAAWSEAGMQALSNNLYEEKR